jgi:methylenetetrahydrofolate dehydrogenase (NADP+) / methenyltetrahydrofolate cyclohydrolase
MLESHSCGGSVSIDGKRASKRVLARVAEKTRALAAQGLKPGLAVVLVGEDPASQVYVKSKGKAAQACGFHSVQHDLAATTSEAELLALVEKLNADPAIHGILLQLPLPKRLDPSRVIEAISPGKDVDGLHPFNVGLLASGDTKRALVPCTSAGGMVLLDMAAKTLGVNLSGAEAVVVGRSNLVGKPIAQLLLGRNATVTIAHSRTRDLAATVARADVLFAAVGRPDGRGPRRGRAAEDEACRRCRLRRGDRARRRHYPGAWRRRADDHRDADGKYAPRGALEGWARAIFVMARRFYPVDGCARLQKLTSRKP